MRFDCLLHFFAIGDIELVRPLHVKVLKDVAHEIVWPKPSHEHDNEMTLLMYRMRHAFVLELYLDCALNTPYDGSICEDLLAKDSVGSGSGQTSDTTLTTGSHALVICLSPVNDVDIVWAG